MVKLITPDADIVKGVLKGYTLHWAQVNDSTGETFNVSVIHEQLKAYTAYSGADVARGYMLCGYYCSCPDSWRNFTNLNFTCTHVMEVEETFQNRKKIASMNNSSMSK